VQSWLHLRPEDRDEFADRAPRVCALYQEAPALHEQGVHVVCTDEKTGIQAKERLGPRRGPIPGYRQRQEAHYRRHGTLTLIPNFEVATGFIVAPTISPSRSGPMTGLPVS